MTTAPWKDSEKKVARRVFEAAVQRELQEIMVEFKSKAANAKEPDDMWAVEEFLAQARREFDRKYDFRYSQLELVFGRLLREGRIHEPELTGLAEEKLAFIRRVASL